MLQQFLPVVLLLALFAAIAAIAGATTQKHKKRSGARATDDPPFRAAECLLSDAEMRFYRALREAMGADAEVMAKVRMEDLLRVRRRGKDVFAWRGRVKSRHVDFVVCNGELRPLVVVELDDASHTGERSRETDAMKDAVFSAAGLPLVRFRAALRYDAGEIRGRLKEVVRGSPA